MRKVNKACVLSIIVVFSILNGAIVNPVHAETISKPSIPEFTIQYTDHSYDVSSNTSIDPFTGKSIRSPAQHIVNETIQISIKNQTISSSNYLYYEVRMKGHFSQDWTNVSFLQANTHSEYTVILYLSPAEGKFHFSGEYFDIPSGGVIDFQVQAQVWTYVQSNDIFGSWNQVILGASDWSSTQTVTIDNTSTPVNPTPTPSQSSIPSNSPSPTASTGPINGQSGIVFGITWEQIVIILLIVVVAVLAFALVFSRERSLKQTASPQTPP